MRTTCVALAVAALLQPVAAGAGRGTPNAAAGRRPNVLLFLADDQRNDLLGCAGHPILKTPTIDRLARQGVRFENAFVTTSICAASRASILTGLYERTHKFTFRTPPIAEKFCATSYPAVLKRAGYRTGFVGKFGVSVARGSRARMFDFFKPLSRSPYFKRQKDGSRRHVSEIAGDHAMAFLRERSTKQPFCLSVSFNAPHAEDGDKRDHYPWPKAVDGLYAGVHVPPPRLSGPAIFAGQPEFLKKSLNRQRWFWRWDTPARYQKNVRAYFRMISGIDGVMGRVLAELKRLGLDNNTVVIYLADNGYYLGSRGFAGKWSHYEESLRVPMIVFDPRSPKSQRGRTVKHMALNVDVAPTIIDLAKLKVPGRISGQSLLPLLTGTPPDSWRTDFFCEHLFDHAAIPKWEGVRGQRYVYARYFEQRPAYEFLHDLKADPQQLKNFAADESYAAVLKQMRSRCNSLRDGYGGAYSTGKFPTLNRRRKPQRTGK